MFCHFGEALSRLCRERRVSRRALAKHLGIGVAELAEIEDCRSLPPAQIIDAAAALFGMSRDELLVRSGVLPPWVERLLREQPERALDALRGTYSDRDRDLTAPFLTVPAPAVVLETGYGHLHKGDCVNFMRSIGTDSVDVVFADPPFNLNKDYGVGVRDDLAEAHYFEWSRAWLSEAARVLKPGGSLFAYNIPKWGIHLASWLSQVLEFRHWITVDMKFSLPIPGRLYPSHYALLYFTKGPRARTFAPPRLPIETCRHCGGEIRDYGGYKDRMNPRGVNLTDVWTDMSPVRHARFKRRKANELPLRLLDRVLDIGTVEGDLVLDPFGGSGTTFVAAELKGRRWIGCEIGDCTPIIERFRHLDRERETLKELRANINTLFTVSSLALRRRHGHDTSRYRLDDTQPAAMHEGDLFDRE